METNDFYLRVAQSLAGCQLVEQELKLYITEAFLLAKKCIGDSMPFRMSGQDCENYSLERLIKTFQKLSNNSELVAELNNFKDERNFLAHNAIAHCLDLEGELFQTSAVNVEQRIVAIQAQATRLRLALHEEANKFRPQLYFDDLGELKEDG